MKRAGRGGGGERLGGNVKANCVLLKKKVFYIPI